MADTWKPPQYAHNSDVDQDESNESDSERSPEPDTKPVVDPWNDPEDDDDDDDDDSPRKAPTSSPDYLGTEKPRENKKRGASAAWDALGDEDGDTTDDDIPPGVSVGGMETKNASGGIKHEPSIDVPDASRNGHSESKEPLRKRQRLSQERDVKPETNLTTIFKSAASGASPRPAIETHVQPLPPPTYVPPGPPPPGATRNPMDRYPPHVPVPGLVMKSFFGITPRDEFVRIIGEWLLQVCRGQRGIEVGRLFFFRFSVMTELIGPAAD